jgi:NAD-dependent dihydropyrimidine dehydrogenase PreA subunit
MSEKLCVVLSQSRSGRPERRKLEEGILAAFGDQAVELAVVPHLVDLTEDHPAAAFLRSLSGDVVVLSWLYPRAAFWTLHALGVSGKMGQPPVPGVEQGESCDAQGAADLPSKASMPGEFSGRFLYPISLGLADGPGPVVRAVLRIAEERASSRESHLHRTAPGGQPAKAGQSGLSPEKRLLPPAEPRWYPVIDYSRCGNCLECIDFCLFGVYGLDDEDRIYVESPDNCKTGCPACSRVCPASAIMFPEYKDPAIAGAEVAAVSPAKTDLSETLGGAETLEAAAKERLDALVKDGRAPSGDTGAAGKRKAPRRAGTPRDELDELMDALEETDI